MCQQEVNDDWMPMMTSSSKRRGLSRRDFFGGAAAGLVLSVLDTSILHGAQSHDATFRSDGFSLTLSVPQGEQMRLRSLQNPRTGFEWIRPDAPMGPVWTATDKTVKEWTARSSAFDRAAKGNRFTVMSQADQIRTSQVLQAVAGSPIVELQTEFQNTGNTSYPAVTAFGPFRIALGDEIGPLRAHVVSRNKYGVDSIPIEDTIALSGGRWNAPEYGGLIVLEAVAKEEFLLVGIEWERDWHYRVVKDSSGIWLSVEVSDLTHDLAAGERLGAPRVFIGLAAGDLEQAFLAARHYMQLHVFPESPQNWPWVDYDFWSTDSTGVEKALFDEVEFSVGLGVDLFCMDASWYSGSSTKGTGDWGCGLGNYTDDRNKYPSGLAAISRRVHQTGMKFGLWVGPNIVDSRLVGSVIPQQWTAQVNGKDQTLHPGDWEGAATQVCLACRPYIEFLKRELVRIIREFQLDWLKWDNSGIPGSPANGCNRTDHGHQAGDASYSALVGQYEIFQHLHQLFPDLVLEQCGYGSRLDYGLARTIRANWLSDASFPSDAVRQNALAASYLYPSADNGAWIVVEDPDLLKSAGNASLLDTIFRSRMISLFGFGTINGQLKERISLFPEPILAAARRNTVLYKRYRHLLQHDCFRLLNSGDAAGPQPQAVQFSSPDGQEAVVLVFRGESARGSIRLPLRGLHEDRRYRVAFANDGSMTEKNGSELVSQGITVSLPSLSMSEIVLINARDHA
jgi:alpha-galactosidase